MHNTFLSNGNGLENIYSPQKLYLFTCLILGSCLGRFRKITSVLKGRIPLPRHPLLACAGKINILSLLVRSEGSLLLCCISSIIPYFMQSWSPTHLGDLLKLDVTVFSPVCLNILWLKTIAWGGKADGTCLDSVSGMQKLESTFLSHNIGRAKGTYQNWDLHRTHRHPSPKLWSCSAAQILLI